MCTKTLWNQGLKSSSLLRVACAAVLAVVLVPGAAGAEPPALSEARRLYNVGQYEAAIEASVPFREAPEWRAVALLVAGRAGLERFRQTADAADLMASREALRAVDASRLDGRDRLELVVGLGEALYLEEEYAAAADVLDGAVERADELGSRARDQLLDWWATAMDRHAQLHEGAGRIAIYDRVLDEMRRELRRDQSSAAASYWMVAASRAKGDLEGAWDAALAAWVRSQLTPDRGAALRPDLDRLVLEGIIPDRARRLLADPTGQAAKAEGNPAPPRPGASIADLELAITGMAAEWNEFKQRWTEEPPSEAPPSARGTPPLDR